MSKAETYAVHEPWSDIQQIAACDRCGLAHHRDGERQDQWNLETRQGFIVGFLCPDCQTPAETAEAAINEATLEYAQDERGRLLARPKVAV